MVVPRARLLCVVMVISMVVSRVFSPDVWDAVNCLRLPDIVVLRFRRPLSISFFANAPSTAFLAAPFAAPSTAPSAAPSAALSAAVLKYSPFVFFQLLRAILVGDSRKRAGRAALVSKRIVGVGVEVAAAETVAAAVVVFGASERIAVVVVASVEMEALVAAVVLAAVVSGGRGGNRRK